jgi:hypothetical protein
MWDLSTVWTALLRRERVTAREAVPAANSAGHRHVFVIGADGKLLSWSPRAPAAVSPALIGIVRGCIAPLAAEACSFFEIAMLLDERFGVHIIRNAAAGPVSFIVVVDDFL